MPRHTHPRAVSKHGRDHIRAVRLAAIERRLAARQLRSFRGEYWEDPARQGGLAHAAPWWLYRSCRCDWCVAKASPRAERLDRAYQQAEISSGLSEWEAR